MFESKAAMFLYSVSPVHMGAGTALGAIDNPIQRERHTQHPMLAGSGLKGALRHEAMQLWKDDLDEVYAVFGPETAKASDHAGALAISDAQIVLYPVRSLKSSYVYATCPTALRRLARLLALAGHPLADLASLVEPEPNQALVADESLLNDGKLVLEAYAFEGREGRSMERTAQWLGDHALTGDGMDYFQDKMKKHLVVLHDDRFNYFVRNATVVEPHVRIDDETGTASTGGLFYTENVPPEALFVSLVMASQDRRKGMGKERPSDLMLSKLRNALGTRMVQVGGDATTGRGQMILSFVDGEVAS